MSSNAASYPPDRPFSTITNGIIAIEPWPAERRLVAVATVVSIVLWLVLVVSVIGIAYAGLVGIFFFLMHVAFVTHVRGNGVRLSTDQFPELYGRVQELGQWFGIERVPETYIIQAGGALNALATRFLRSYIVILYVDLLEACGDDHAARDMIIGHELGHIRAGHLRRHWFLLPASLVPFLGGALSRAREYTCDRFGFAGSSDSDGALRGLAILAAGGSRGRQLNLQAFVRQRQDLNTGWMTIGQWLSSHPPLAKRVAALQPSLGMGQTLSAAGAMRAALIVFAGLLPLSVAGWYGGKYIVATSMAELAAAGDSETYAGPVDDAAMEQLQGAISTASAFLAAEVDQGRGLPETYLEFENRWYASRPDEPIPIDPFDGAGLGYYVTADGYVLWSSGPDRVPDTDDDIGYSFEM